MKEDINTMALGFMRSRKVNDKERYWIFGITLFIVAAIICLILLSGCSYVGDDDYVYLANHTCIGHKEIYIGYEEPTISADYFKVKCISQDRTKINNYFFTREEYLDRCCK